MKRYRWEVGCRWREIFSTTSSGDGKQSQVAPYSLAVRNRRCVTHRGQDERISLTERKTRPMSPKDNVWADGSERGLGYAFAAVERYLRANSGNWALRALLLPHMSASRES